MSIQFLESFNPKTDLDDFQYELLEYMYYENLGFTPEILQDDVYETFKSIEQKNLMKYMNRFLKSFVDHSGEKY